MATRPLPPIEFLRECFSYDPDEGVVRWKARPRAHFANDNRCSGWATSMPGTEGSVDEHGYVVFRVTYEQSVYRLRAHNIAFALVSGRTDFSEVDHRNLVKSQNTSENLREATRQQNNANRMGWAKSGLPKGVTFANGRFRASASYRGRTKQIGTFSRPADAHAAYCEWAKERHGEFFNPGPDRPSVFD